MYTAGFVIEYKGPTRQMRSEHANRFYLEDQLSQLKTKFFSHLIHFAELHR